MESLKFYMFTISYQEKKNFVLQWAHQGGEVGWGEHNIVPDKYWSKIVQVVHVHL